MVKIYTKTGDKGETGLIGGKRVSKGAQRIRAYGEVDELNAALGVAMALAGENNKDIADSLAGIQADLFVIGACLATPPDYHGKQQARKISPQQVEALEKLIDKHQKDLPELQNFILPSGSLPGSWLHFARTVCRRAERETVLLSKDEKIEEAVLHYLNRLSDLLFVLARTVNHRAHAPEIPWIARA